MLRKIKDKLFAKFESNVFHNDILQRFEFNFSAFDILYYSKRKKDQYDLRIEYNTVIIKKDTPQVQALLEELKKTTKSNDQINSEIASKLSFYVTSYFDYAYQEKFDFIKLEKKIFENANNLSIYNYPNHNEIIKILAPDITSEFEEEEKFIKEFTKNPYY